MRELSRGGRRKNDVIDAAAAASVAALQGDASPVPAEDLSTVLSLLEERRANLAAARTRAVSQLHALLRDLVPGGAQTDLSAAAAAGLLARVRPTSPVEQARKQLARDLILEIRGVDARMVGIAKRMSATLAAYGSRLPDIDGIGPVLAARIVGRTGRSIRFPTTASFASYAGWHRPRWPAGTGAATASPAPATGNSTARCTWSRSPRSVCGPAKDAPTTTPKEPPARPTTRPRAA